MKLFLSNLRILNYIIDCKLDFGLLDNYQYQYTNPTKTLLVNNWGKSLTILTGVPICAPWESDDLPHSLAYICAAPRCDSNLPTSPACLQQQCNSPIEL